MLRVCVCEHVCVCVCVLCVCVCVCTCVTIYNIIVTVHYDTFCRVCRSSAFSLLSLVSQNEFNAILHYCLHADLSTSSDNIQTSTVSTTSSGSHSTGEIEEPPSKRRREAAESSPMPPPSN